MRGARKRGRSARAHVEAYECRSWNVVEGEEGCARVCMNAYTHARKSVSHKSAPFVPVKIQNRREESGELIPLQVIFGRKKTFKIYFI